MSNAKLMARMGDGSVQEIGGGMRIRYIEKGDYLSRPLAHTVQSYSSEMSLTTSTMTTSSWNSNQDTSVAAGYKTYSRLISQSGSRLGNTQSTRTSHSWTVEMSLQKSISVSFSSYLYETYSHSAEVYIPNVLSFPMRNTVSKGSLVDCRFGEAMFPYAQTRQLTAICGITAQEPTRMGVPQQTYAPDNILHPIFEDGDTDIKITWSKAGSYDNPRRTVWSTRTTYISQGNNVSQNMLVNFVTTSAFSTTWNTTNTSSDSWLSSLLSTVSTKMFSYYSNQFKDYKLMINAANSYTSYMNELWKTASDRYSKSYTMNERYLTDPKITAYVANLRDYQIIEYM